MVQVHPVGFEVGDTRDGQHSLRAGATGERRSVTFHDNHGIFGVKIDDDGRVCSVQPNTQAAEAGVQVGWRIESFGDTTLVSVQGLALGKEKDFSGFVHRKIKFAQSRNQGNCEVIFLLGDSPPAPKILEQSEKFRSLAKLSEKERSANLGSIESMSQKEKMQLLGESDAVENLLCHRGAAELDVLLGEKSATDIGRSFDLFGKLSAEEQITTDSVKGMDLAYTDGAGNTALHLIRTPEQATVLLRSNESLLERRNHKGETVVEAVMRRLGGSSRRAAVLKFFQEKAWNAVNVARRDGGVILEGDAEKEICTPVVPWPDVRAVLVSDTVESFREGMESLSNAFEKARPGVEADSYAGFWTEMLYEHCFGSIEGGSSSASKALEHTEVSTERLLDVFRGIGLLLRACSDPTRAAEDASELKDMTKGLLTATKGPNRPPFDPRKPYRQQFVALVRELQNGTATMLKDVLEAALVNEYDAVNEVQQFPSDELHDVDTSGAAERRAQARLRMDSPIRVKDKLLANPLGTPDWVLGRYLNDEAWQGLQRSGAIKTASDTIKISNEGGGNMTIEGLTEERVRFCRLHAAWLRGYCNDQQNTIAQKLREMLELKNSSTCGPWPAIADTKVHVFRARSEAKGVPRLLEKMKVAMEEELTCKECGSILKEDFPNQYTALSPTQIALRELLTPACYVCDINGAEVVVDTFSDLKSIYKSLRCKTLDTHGYQIVRTKNGFSSQLPVSEVNEKGGYRDLKLFVVVKIGDTSLPAELQLHTRGFHELKRVMHLPYECSRGSFDHPHLERCWRRSRKLSCCGACCVT